MRYLGELNAYSILVPDIELFIKMHVAKEATTSSRIEGTRTQIDEVFLPEKEIRPEKRDDWLEVQNYIKAMNFGIRELEKLPISIRLIKETHQVLLSGARGKHKLPGEIRRSQNWIGGSNPKDAFYIPPHHEELPELLTDLEKFWHNRQLSIPNLIKIAMSHYQFETIHPFLDGNGRIGRLLITLYLVSNGLLTKPALYLSAHLEKHRAAYYDALSHVRKANDLGHWCRFFLQAVISTAEHGKLTFQRILSLRQETDKQIVTLGRRAENGRRLIMYLYGKPSVSVNSVMGILGIKVNPARQLIDACQDLDFMDDAALIKATAQTTI